VILSALVLLLGVIAIVIAVAVAPSTPTPRRSATPPSTATTAPATTGGFHVVGNQVLDATGRQFIPYGFVVWCLSSPDLSCGHGSSSNPNTDADKIRAAASFWHANVVRIQVAWQHLFPTGNSAIDASYLAQLDSEVQLANSLHMVAIITLQTERYQGSVMPDAQAVAFWTVMARHFAHSPMVFFDLFNEPRLSAKHWPEWSEAGMWSIWQLGGTVTLDGDGSSTTFVGMQQLVDTIRAAGADNIIVAEGNQSDHDLSGLPTHVLSGNDIAYGMEPDIGRGVTFPFGGSSAVSWYTNWGALSATYPLLMEAMQDYPGAALCNPRSPQLFPELLSALEADHLGMIFYSMDPGIAVIGTDLTQPTSFEGVTRFDCGADLATNAAGAGQDLLAWFQANSRAAGT
jgi:hypothetical protein